MAKTYNTISTFTSGQILTATQMNGLGTNVNNYRVPPICRVKRSGNLNYTGGTDIAWNAEDYDTDSMHDNSTNNARITVTTAGVYLLTMSINLTFTGTLTRCSPFFMIDGTTFTGETQYLMSATTAYYVHHTSQLVLTSSNYVTARMTIGGATSPIIVDDASTWLQATWLGQVS